MDLLLNLAQIKQESPGNENQRHMVADQSFQQGMDLFAQAQAEQFKNAAVLKDVCRLLIQAVQNNRKNPEPYVALGYLFILVENYSMARQYLTEALREDPENADARSFLDFIVEHQLQKTRGEPRSETHSTIPLLSENETTDFGALSDKLEHFIYAQIKKISALPPPEPTLDRETMHRLDTTKTEIAETIGIIQKQLKILDEEIDTTELNEKCSTLEIYLKRFEKALALSKEMGEVRQGIKGLQKRLPGMKAEIENAHTYSELNPSERLIEVLMNMCDQMADRLDEMEQKKYPVQSLIKHYETFVGEVENLHRLLDKVSEHFPGSSLAKRQ